MFKTSNIKSNVLPFKMTNSNRRNQGSQNLDFTQDRQQEVKS